MNSKRWLPVVLLAACVWAGCGQPRISADNRRLIASLRTAISAKNAEWLAENRKLVEERHSAGSMPEEEFAAFTQILTQAEKGEWEEAERAVVALHQAQRSD